MHDIPIHRRDMLAGSAAVIAARLCRAAEPVAASHHDRWQRELERHRIQDVRVGNVQMHYPRLVGKNARLDVHGRGPRVLVCRIVTDHGAAGWGAFRGPRQAADGLPASLRGRRLTDVFAVATGVTDDRALPLDMALHDLAGVILDVPVYQMLGAHGPTVAACYSGMIYFDDLEPAESPAGIDRVLENCHSDYERGYRQLKVKIGRAHRWMPAGKGMARDAEVTRRIAEAFADVDILVDGNDGFTIDTMLEYLESIGQVKLFWIEEPFREKVADYARLRRSLLEQPRRTLLADGEAAPDWNVLDDMTRRKLLDVQLVDIVGYGFTGWRRLMPQLKQHGVLASPHAWGHLLKTHYVSHLAAGLGNVVTIEGVTCSSDDVDFGDYVLQDGKLSVSSSPGFGMKLLKDV